MDLLSRIGNLINAIGSDINYLISREIWQGVVWSTDPPVLLKSGTVIAYGTVGSPGSGVGFNSSKLAGDYAAWRGAIGAGTWNIRQFYTKGPANGIVNIDYSLNNGSTWVNITTALDTYASAASSTLYVEKAGVVVPSGTNFILIRWTVTGKNASSTAIQFVAGATDLTRTS